MQELPNALHILGPYSDRITPVPRGSAPGNLGAREVENCTPPLEAQPASSASLVRSDARFAPHGLSVREWRVSKFEGLPRADFQP